MPGVPRISSVPLLEERLSRGLEWVRVTASESRSKAHPSEIKFFYNNFSILDFLLLASLVRGEKYSVEIADALSHFNMPMHAPIQQVVYTHLKNLLRDGLLTARQEENPRRVYFSLTQPGKNRVESICDLIASLNKIARSIRNWSHSPSSSD